MTTERASFREQTERFSGSDKPVSEFMPTTEEGKLKLATEIEQSSEAITSPFESKFDPLDMRQLALVAHNHMKPVMKNFVETYSEVLKKFRITGTQTTMRMCKSMWGEDNPEVEYGTTCTSGPLGGDAQIAALMCLDDLGALFFFMDPLTAHPHQADIDSLTRLANCHNIIVCPNPTSGMSMMHTFRRALETGNRGMIPSFFTTLESPAVEEYRSQQERALVAAVSSGVPVQEAQQSPGLGVDASMHYARSTLDAIDELDLDYTEHGDNEGDDKTVDADEVRETVAELQRLSMGGETGDISTGNRSSTLAGIKKKRRGSTRKAMRKLARSLRRLGSSS